jgi:hypothetical protein
MPQQILGTFWGHGWVCLTDQPELLDELKQYSVTGLGISIDGLK